MDLSNCITDDIKTSNYDNNNNKTFCGFSMCRNQYWAGRVYDLCV